MVPSVPEPAATVDLQRQAEIERELQLARDLQQGLLLEAIPRLPGWEISAVSLPARDLGGDLYDFMALEHGRHGIMIGDVSGKGLPAALRMAVTRTVFRFAARRDESPGSTLALTNREVLRDIPHGMVTMLYATLDLRGGELSFANAGHNYPIVVNGEVHEVELSGLPLGVDGESDYEEATIKLHHGDTALLYTDGIVEAENSAGEMFGYERLEELLRMRSALKPRALVAMLLQEVRAWSNGNQTDDITVVVLRRRYAQLTDELNSVVIDVLGAERAHALWPTLTLPNSNASASVWLAALPEVIQAVQAQTGRGLARELHGQLRLVLEEYRDG
jgi:sigma-B regulation protein RsbU (phosphoserine phosphatase)